MSKLFSTKSGKTKSAFTIASSGGSELVKRLQKLESGGETIIKRTTSDFKSRAPAWVSKGVRKHYNVDAAVIKRDTAKPRRGKTQIKLAGLTVDGAQLEFKGRLLTPTHFKMRPAERPPGNKKYKVRAAIIKGQSKPLTSAAFLAPATKKKPDAKIIPWQRVGDGRLPVHVIKAISVPQMVGGLGGDGEEHVSLAHESIRKEIDQGLDKRFEHHIKRAMK